MGLDHRIFRPVISFPFVLFSDATEVIALVRGVAELPCDVTTPDPEDPVRLVLWYRSDSSTPIYRYCLITRITI
jgi:hypothetical protein